MTNFWRKCQVLMWKNLILRRRHWFLTLFETTMPVFLFWLIAWMLQKGLIIKKASPYPATVNPLLTESSVYDLGFIYHDVVDLAYVPDTLFTRKVIKEFNKTLVSYLQHQSKLGSFDSFQSELEMEKCFLVKYHGNNSTFTNHRGYGIVFENVDKNSKIPIDFKYKIRSTVPKWDTKDIFPQYTPDSPTDEGDNYLYQGFLAVQMAIDNAYIKVVGRGSFTPSYSMSIQEFPFPAYKRHYLHRFFRFYFPLYTMLSFITISISVLKKVVEEKASGVKETMKVMGLETWMVWAGCVLNSMMIYVVTCLIITVLLCTEFDPDRGSFIDYTHWSIVFLLFLLFCLASIFFCFAISAIFMNPTIAITAGAIIWFISYFTLEQYVGRATLPFAVHLLLCLIPMFNMCTGYVVIAAFEDKEVTITWLNLFQDATGRNGMSLGITLLMFLVQTAVYMFITWYITSIHPGPYGRAEPWYFIFKCFSNSKTFKESILNNEDDKDERYETPPKDLEVGLRIRNLQKVFNGNVVAVDKVNLDIYEGQITALLGHNGAGKTTTMSILTGMYSPTTGSVYAKDYNIFEHMDRFHNSLGLCPQHDLLFPNLTALEHLIFFGTLKGMQMRLARKEGMKLLKMLNVSGKKGVLADQLSGGMKRKLSLAVALIGSPKVLMLDEPTSGMDPESRREMWDLLLSLRGARTIMITTHSMEEANVLGDRIAIMDHGKVKCYGTTPFLKRIYGTGYQLTVTKSVGSSLEAITDTIRKKLPGVEVKTVLSTQVTYKVPQEEAAHLPAMFAAIEDNKDHLNISGVGISCTTMEEVFLKVGQLAKEEKYEFDKTSSHSSAHNMMRNSSDEALTYNRRKGFSLISQQFASLVFKRSLFTIRRPVATLIFFLIPLLLTWMTMKNDLVDVMRGQKDPPLTFGLSLYGQTAAYVSGPPEMQRLYKDLVSKQGSMTDSVQNDMVGSLLAAGVENMDRYKTNVIIAADFNTTTNSSTALYNGLAYHSAPIAVNMISNTLLRSNPKTKHNTITTTNHPLDLENPMGVCNPWTDVSLWMGAFIWLFLVPTGVKVFVMSFMAFPHTERTSNAKQLQLMTGVPPPVYWFACFVWDYFVYIISCAAVFLVIVITDTALLTEPRDYGVLLLILLLYGVSGISCTYLYSFLGKSSTMAGSVFTCITVITGVFAPMMMPFLIIWLDKDSGLFSTNVVVLLNYLLYLEPQFAFGSAIMNYAYLLSEYSACKQCYEGELYKTECPEKSYLEFPSLENPNGILTFVIFLAVDWILYLALILRIEYGFMGRGSHCLKVTDQPPSEDSDVRDERDRVDVARDARDDSVVLTVDRLAKNFHHSFLTLKGLSFTVSGGSISLNFNGLAKKYGPSFAAVQGVSFRVSAGECFGLLGVNGAGKTTIFRMLTGDEKPTGGSATILDHDLVRNRSKYLAQIGYCPQFDGINEFLTGEEVLRLFANLRGIPQEQIQVQIDHWISLLGLDECRHRVCGKYSRGNKRKLSTAMALIGDPPVLLLDEPTTGVDPMARRNLWGVLARCQKGGQTIILTSDSMEECEALCTRLTIMERGKMKCIGTYQDLKQRYGQGYTIMVKLNSLPNQETLVNHLKEEIKQIFNCTLKDEHMTLLHYQMTDTSMSLSKLFSKMETLKKSNSVIEDYTVGDTTLEQVFIAFARQSEN